MFEEVVSEGAQPPKVMNMKAEQGPRDHMTIRCRLECPSLTIRLVSSQKLPDRLLVTNYDARLLNLRGEVSEQKN